MEIKMIKKFNHVGVVVKSIEDALELFVNVLGFEASEVLDLKDMGIKSAMVSLGEVKFELMEPIDLQGGIQKFLEKRGGGLHHVSLEVDDMAREREALTSKGVQLMEKEPLFYNETYISFVHPKSTGGVLMELIQKV
jgi:methylmalonyl-CoA epimerase